MAVGLDAGAMEGYATRIALAQDVPERESVVRAGGIRRSRAGPRQAVLNIPREEEDSELDVGGHSNHGTRAESEVDEEVR